jgi:hypothetical protein
MSYKIKIPCTHAYQLSFEGGNIKKNVVPIINDIIQDFNYVEQILMVTRKLNDVDTIFKSFEIFCDYQMEKHELIEFIEEMEEKGFKFGKKTTIEFIDTESNDRIHKIKYSNYKSLPIYPFTFKSKRRPSSYSSWIIYKKKSKK